MQDINDFRARAHGLASQRNGVLLDPTTMDELALEHSITDQNASEVTIQLQNRWPLEAHPFVNNSAFPITIPHDQIKEVLPDVYNNIRARDFKLIDTSKFVLSLQTIFRRGIERSKSRSGLCNKYRHNSYNL